MSEIKERKSDIRDHKIRKILNLKFHLFTLTSISFNRSKDLKLGLYHLPFMLNINVSLLSNTEGDIVYIR